MAWQCSATVWYADLDNASGTEDGTSWETAFTTIQPAIDAAFESGGGQVWVAEGTYSEQRSSLIYDPPRETGSLLMREEVHLFGGFAGNETVRAQRDWEAHPAIIDGSVARFGEAALHVINGADMATLDGFTITGGNASNGGGMRIWECSPRVQNCFFVDNKATGNNSMGGAIFMQNSEAEIIDCTFSGNSASRGGAVRSSYGNPTIGNCTFRNNSATEYSGGAISGGATVSNCTFEGNEGGAVSGVNKVTDSVFVGNSASDGRFIAGGKSFLRCVFKDNFGADAVISVSGSASTTLTNCVFYGNTGRLVSMGGNYNPSLGISSCTFADNQGSPAIYVSDGVADIMNSIFWNDGVGEEIRYFRDSSTVIGNCHIRNWNNDPNLYTDPMFVDPENGDYRLAPGSPCINKGGSYPEYFGPPDHDIIGTHRPLGGRYDIGAYEFINFDINGDGVTDASDIQLVINAALGYIIAPFEADINGDGAIDAVDIQLVTNAALGL